MLQSAPPAPARPGAPAQKLRGAGEGPDGMSVKEARVEADRLAPALELFDREAPTPLGGGGQLIARGAASLTGEGTAIGRGASTSLGLSELAGAGSILGSGLRVGFGVSGLAGAGGVSAAGGKPGAWPFGVWFCASAWP